MKLLILQTGVPNGLSKYTTFCQMFLDEGGIPRNMAEIIDLPCGEFPMQPVNYRAVIVTGSPYMVTDHEEWSERGAEWLAKAVKAKIPIFGVCYGHQLLSYALGGDVYNNPFGLEIGTVEITLKENDCPILDGVPSIFHANVLHSQTVSILPPNSYSIAYSDMDDKQFVVYGENTFSCQFHPEFSGTVTKEYLEMYANEEPSKADYYRRKTASVSDTPYSIGILQNFVKRYCLT
jgi:GMP synthase (glutamine-hydrolysing)